VRYLVPPVVLAARIAFTHAPIAMAVTSVQGRLVSVNRALATLLGRSTEALRGVSLFQLTHPDDVPSAHRSCDELRVRRSARWRHECRLVHASSHTVPVQVVTSWVEGDPSNEPHLVMVIDDIGDRRALEAALRHQPLHDPLTGLANRVLFDDRLRHALGRGRREGTGTCMLMIDLDDFKSVNDGFGHAVDDEVLTAFASRLRSVLREIDTAARLGGDEFAVICESSDLGQAHALVDRLQASLTEPLQLSDGPVAVGVSVGIGYVRESTDSSTGVAQLLREADRRMYEQKRHRSR
jgi:diguanylate cyclase (GGDEF)-like protein/PAS domain S-box-containing protein